MGVLKQIKEIDAIQTKIVTFSLSIQELIQNIINLEKPILSSANGNPFLENACCNSTNNTIEYFTKAAPNIITTNNQILYLSKVFRINNQEPYSLNNNF